MKKQILALAVLTAISTTVAAEVNVTPYGSVGMKLVVGDDANGVDNDLEQTATKARLGVKAVEKTDFGSVMGQIEVDYDDEAMDSDGSATNDKDIDVREARVIIGTKTAGALIFGSATTSGMYADMYSHVDIFSHGGYHYFQQASHGKRIFAYKTPVVAGGLYAVFASVQVPGAGDNEDVDVLANRLVWKKDGLKLAFGYLVNNFTTADDDVRESLGVSYDMGALSVGATWENGIGSGAVGGNDVIGVTGAWKLGNGTLKGGVYSQSSDTAAKDGLTATTLEYAHAITGNLTGFVSVDAYDVDSSTSGSNVGFGVNMSF
jgi:hypothetical protein